MADETCAIDFPKLPLEVYLTRFTPVKFNDEEVKECERYLGWTIFDIKGISHCPFSFFYLVFLPFSH